MFTFQSNSNWPRLIWVLVAAVFVADMLLPQQFDIVFAYLLAHFLAIFFREKSDVLLLAVITTTLTLIGAALKPHEIPLEQVFLERLPPIVSFWAAAFFVIRFIDLREDEEQQKDRFQALFRFATNGILVTNTKGEIIMANPSLANLFGYQIGELISKPVEILIPSKFHNQHIHHRDGYHQNPHPRNMGSGLNLHGLKKDGSEFPVEVSLSPFRTKEGIFVVAFIVDNTTRKQYENSILEQKQALSQLSEALQYANDDLESKVSERTTELEHAKNDLAAALEKERELGELKTRFVSMASHEFRTPLTSVLSSAGLIEQYTGRQDMDNIMKHASRIKNAVNSLNSILTEFLSLGRLEEGRVTLQLETVDLPTCVGDVINSMRHSLKTGQTFNYDHKGEQMARVDCSILRNMLINLISNAVKYSPEEKPIEISSEITPEFLTVSVRDHGIGIPETEQKHLFDRFFRASNAVNVQGTGLGLHIVQRYAEMLGGVVHFTSDIDQGSTFSVTIPQINNPDSGGGQD